MFGSDPADEALSVVDQLVEYVLDGLDVVDVAFASELGEEHTHQTVHVERIQTALLEDAEGALDLPQHVQQPFKPDGGQLLGAAVAKALHVQLHVFIHSFEYIVRH